MDGVMVVGEARVSGNEFYPSDIERGCRLHLVGNQVMSCEAVGMSHGCVVLIQASDSVHFVVDAAGDVLDVLHVGPGRNIKDKRLSAEGK